MLVADGAGFAPSGAAPGAAPNVAPGAVQGTLPLPPFDPPPPPALPMLESAMVLRAEEVVSAQLQTGVDNDTTRKREAAATAAVLAQAAAEAQARAAIAPTAGLASINNKKLKGGHNAMGPTRGPSALLTTEHSSEPPAPATSSGVPGRSRGPMKMFLLPVGLGARGLPKPATEAATGPKPLEPDAATHSATLGGTPTGGAGQGRPKASMKMFLLPVGLSARGLAKPLRETTPPRPPEEPAPPPPPMAPVPARRSGTRTPEPPQDPDSHMGPAQAERQGPTKRRSQSQSTRSKRHRSRSGRSLSKRRTRREERPERGRRRRSGSRAR